MTESELRARLRAMDADSDPTVQQRAWQAVRAAYRPAPRRRARPRWRMTVPVVACVLALAGVAVATASPPRQALARWLRDAIGLSTPPHPRPMLAGLPGGGQLLVNSSAGPWIVSPTGHRRYLGPYTAAAWSPHSLYVVAWRRSQLTALDPLGRVQWTLPTDGEVSVARWSPDGYRIAYVAAGALSILAGDGSANHQLRGDAAAVAPAWQPHTDTTHRIAFVDRQGAIHVLDADTGAQSWRSKARPALRQLLWSPDGTRLLAVSAGRLDLYDSRGRRLATSTTPTGQTIGQAAFAPTGDRVALAVRQAGAATDSVALVTATRRGLRQAPEILFSARERVDAISWSPDDQWLLASSSSADQWIFIRTRSPVRLQAVSRITGQFQADRTPARGFPTLGGWQRVATARSGG